MTAGPKCPLDGHSPGCLPFLAQPQCPHEGVGPAFLAQYPVAQARASGPTFPGAKSRSRREIAMPVQLRCVSASVRVVIALMLIILPLTTSWAQSGKDRQMVPAARQATAEEKRSEQVEARAAGTPDSLVQLNTALEGLADKVSQGVVQILVTGYGAVEESGHQETALIARQRAIGSGVVVDPSGYVMTNAHVVEGA